MRTPTTSRIGLVWRGDRDAPDTAPKAESRLGELFEALAELGVDAEQVVWADDAADEVREQLLELDGALVWVNPIQDDADRARLDAVLRDVADRGVWVSADPDVILAMGTKEVLYRTRTLGWGSDTDLYRSTEELRSRFPERLGRDGARVLKQARGNGGNGVWKVERRRDDPDDGAQPSPDAIVRVQHAQDRNGESEHTTLGAFMTGCERYFAWSGCLIDQPLVARLAEGLVRCYLVESEVVGFCHQWPRGLLDEFPAAGHSATTRPPMEDADIPLYASLRARVEREWVPQMQELLGIPTERLPAIWDADFLYGPKSDHGEDTYVLCEVNVSAVWPYPPQATPQLAATAVERMREFRKAQPS